MFFSPVEFHRYCNPFVFGRFLCCLDHVVENSSIGYLLYELNGTKFWSCNLMLNWWFWFYRCIPYRYRQTEQESSSVEDIEVLVISSQKGQGILFPKVIPLSSWLFMSLWLGFPFEIMFDICIIAMWLQGGWELDESMEEAAYRETLEEAGVTGHLEVSTCKNTSVLFSFFIQLCSFTHQFSIFLQLPRLGKWSYKSKSQGTFHEGYMFPLLVNKQLESWPEKTVRKREWVSWICSIWHIVLALVQWFLKVLVLNI